jgi:uncharacterized membrane protein (UPF0127 family)
MIPSATRSSLRWQVILTLFVVAGFTPVVAHAQPATADAQECRPSPERARENLQIVTASGKHPFKVEVARSMEQRAKGLMCRQTMARDHGMLFTFDVEMPIHMWMKNTYLPLDMVFVSRAGVVTAVAANTMPFSEELISSGGPAYAVIELNAGVAEELGIAAGASVIHPAFHH